MQHMESVLRSSACLKELEELYTEAFPANERMPFSQMLSLSKDDRYALRALKNGNPKRYCLRDLGVVVVDGGGADDKISSADVLGAVADGDGDTQRAQMLDGRAVIYVRSRYYYAAFMQNLGERRH